LVEGFIIYYWKALPKEIKVGLIGSTGLPGFWGKRILFKSYKEEERKRREIF